MRMSDTTIEQRSSSSSSSGSCNWTLLSKTNFSNYKTLNPPYYRSFKCAVPHRHCLSTVFAFWFFLPGFTRRGKNWLGRCRLVSYAPIGYGHHGFPSKGYGFARTLILLLENRVLESQMYFVLLKISLVTTRNTEESQNNWWWLYKW